MALSQYQRARILLHRAADQSYKQIADNVGVSQSEVSAVVNEVESRAVMDGADAVVGKEILRGYMEVVGFEWADEVVDALLALVDNSQ